MSGVVLAAEDVGQLAVAITLAELLWYGAESAAVVLTPLVARASGQSSAVPTPFVTRVVLLFTAVGAGVIAVLGGTLVSALFGREFAPADVALRWLLPGIVALSATKVLASDLFGRGRPGRALAAYATGATASIALSLALLPGGGIAGAALASTGAYVAAAAVIVVLYRRETNVTLGELLVVRRDDVGAAWDLARGVAARRVTRAGAPPPSAP
ncbi:MAG: hypothetical protein E6I57_03330 [Chloroflexi bacterium]|nr:MAG: hypothetical protein E6I57_03330 [Chloroflexota bacterium]